MRISDLLIELGLSSEDSIKLFRIGTRDRADMRVFRCEKSKVIFIGSDEHIAESYYQKISDLAYWGAVTRLDAAKKTLRDDRRRAQAIRPLVENRRWLDIGTGNGGILDLLAPACAEVAAVEPQPGPRQALRNDGYLVHADIEDVPAGSFDVITLFHVYEHVTDPIGFLRAVKKRLAPGGRVCIEVPHARDFLIDFLACESFIAFTLWSEHLILHSRQSLARFVAAAGFERCTISGIQRYPLANHLHWLVEGKPAGETHWPQLSTPEINLAYERLLSSLDYTDTLIAWAET